MTPLAVPDATRPIDIILARLQGVRKTGDGYTARCPAHDDRQQSLSIGEGKDEEVLLHCFAGCGVEDIVSAMGLAMADLYPARERSNARPAAPSRGVTVEDLARDKGLPVELLKSVGVEQGIGGVKVTYRLADGSPAPRQRWRRALSAKQGSSWLKGNGPPVPYGLWMLERMRQKSDVLMLVEGESDCWTLWHHGIPALGVPGADMAKTLELPYVERWPQLCAFQEPDRGGETFVAGLVSRLAVLGYKGEFYALKADGFKDPNDLFKRSPDGFEERFKALIQTAQYIDLAEAATETRRSTNSLAVPEAENLTDLGNSRRLVRQHSQDLRYCYPWDKWLIWDGRRWDCDSTGDVVRRAKQTVAAMYREASEVEDFQERQKLVAHALRSESDSKLRAMIRLAESEPGIPVMPEQFDADPWLFNVENGTLNLQTGELRPHSRADLITKIAPVRYDPDAQCPLWLGFLERIMGGNEALVGYLQRVVGYSLTADIREQCLFMLYGTGANGKSTFLETLKSLFGDYGQQAEFSTFLHSNDDRVRNDVAGLMGRRFVSAIEADVGRRLAETLVKQLTGGDTVKARFLFKEFFEFVPTFKVFLAANVKPTIRGQDYAIWRRIRLIPFEVTIPKKEQDRTLPGKLRNELPGILAWAVQGCLAWQRNGLDEPNEVLYATDKYQKDMDILADFIEGRCFVESTAQATSKALYDAYTQWCSENAEEPLSSRVFGMKLKEKGFDQTRSARFRGWVGIGLDDGSTRQGALVNTDEPEADGYKEPETKEPF